MKTVLYRHYGQDNRLLYVGVSNSPISRLNDHRASAPWYEELVRSTYEWFDTRMEALEAERKAIKDEKPEFNMNSGLVFPVRSDGMIGIHEAADLLKIRVGQLRVDCIQQRSKVPFVRELGKYRYQTRFLFCRDDIERFMSQ